MISIRLAIFAALSVAAIACGSDYSSPSTPSPTPTPTPTPGGAATAVTIPSGAEILGNRAFSPDTLDISAGSTVTWTNSDSVSHTSTSNAAGWDSGIIAPGRRADLLLVRGNPTSDILAVRSILRVWREGHAGDRTASLQ